MNIDKILGGIMGNRIVAINENEINRLILDINDFTIKIKKIFNEMESIVDGTRSYYDCNCATRYRNSFNVFKLNFPIMVNNLLTYKRDMQNLKFKFCKQEGVLSDILVDRAKNVSAKSNLK